MISCVTQKYIQRIPLLELCTSASVSTVAWNISWNPLDEMNFTTAVGVSSTLDAHLILWKHLRRTHCSPIVHLLQHTKCFCRQFLQMLAEFHIRTLLLEHHFDERERLLRWYSLYFSRKALHYGCTYSSLHITSHMLLCHDKIVPSPPIRVG